MPKDIKDDEETTQGAAGGTQGTPGGAAPPGAATGGAKGGTQGAQGGASGGGYKTGAKNTGGTRPKPATGPAGPAGPVGRDDGLLQLSPAALQQMLAAAVAAATSTPSLASDGPKLPKFWDEQPAAWFSVFNGHFAGRDPPVAELALFNRMLPLLPTVAVSLCSPLVDNPPPDVFTQAQRLLLSHYQLSPAERGRRLFNCSSLGDRTPTAMLQYMRSLQPGEQEGVLFRHIFVNLLPDVIREVVSSIDSLDEMAATATTVFQSNAANIVSSVALDDSSSPAQVNAVRHPQRSSAGGTRGASGGGNPRRRGVVLCKTDSRYGREAFRCDKPDSCAMRDILKTPENGPAGRN